jgi:hypothetical protein
MAPARNAKGMSEPASSLTCPTRAMIPAPIITPVPSETEPVRESFY